MEKISRSNRLTLILAGALAAVIVVVVVLALSYPDPEPVATSAGADAGTAPATAGAGLAGQGTAGAAAGTVPADQGNTFCRAYVYKRCNELGIGPTECPGIAETGSAVPRNIGLAGCRSVVDDILARAAGLPEETDTVAAGTAPAPADASAVDAGEYEAAPQDEPLENVRMVAGGGASPASEVDPVAVSHGMERIRQLETEIAVARNTYVGTNIGVQSRLDEMRAIAEEIGTPEAKSAYNSMVQRLGRGGEAAPGPVSAGGASYDREAARAAEPPPAAGNSGPAEATPVQTAPASAVNVQSTPPSAGTTAVVEAAPASF